MGNTSAYCRIASASTAVERRTATGLPLLDPFGFDLSRITDPQLGIKFCQQSLEPACIPGSLHAYPHGDSSSFEVAIESFRFPPS